MLLDITKPINSSPSMENYQTNSILSTSSDPYQNPFQLMHIKPVLQDLPKKNKNSTSMLPMHCRWLHNAFQQQRRIWKT